MKNVAPGREKTLELWGKLVSIARNNPDRFGALDNEYRLAESHVEKVVSDFLVSNRESAPEHVDYWLAHGELVGELMYQLAKQTGRNEVLYRQVGILHDADYFMHPHYGGETRLVHPAPLCERLMHDCVHPVVVIAVLEHAGYTGCGEKFSSPLSAAISTCDDLATFISALHSPEFMGKNDYKVSLDMLTPGAKSLAESVISKVPIPVFPDDFNCPHRVLKDINLFINDSLPKALDFQTGEFRT